MELYKYEINTTDGVFHHPKKRYQTMTRPNGDIYEGKFDKKIIPFKFDGTIQFKNGNSCNGEYIVVYYDYEHFDYHYKYLVHVYFVVFEYAVKDLEEYIQLDYL